MVDVTPLVVKALRETGLKVYDENFTTSTTDIPCLSYLLITNKIDKQGDTQEHSDVFYYIKVYAKRNSEIANYSNQVDSIMRKLGFKRRDTKDQVINGCTQRILTYQCLTYEIFE